MCVDGCMWVCICTCVHVSRRSAVCAVVKNILIASCGVCRGGCCNLHEVPAVREVVYGLVPWNPKEKSRRGGGQGLTDGETGTAHRTNQTNQNQTFLIMKFLHEELVATVEGRNQFVKELEPVSRGTGFTLQETSAGI